jgi:hypothetical protein
LPLAGIGGDFEHFSEVLNVLSSDKTLHSLGPDFC